MSEYFIATEIMHLLQQQNYSCVGVFSGHSKEISCCIFNYDCSLVASSSMDKTAKVWEPRMMSCLASIEGHDDEVGISKEEQSHSDDNNIQVVKCKHILTVLYFMLCSVLTWQNSKLDWIYV